jgi:hypothetical protein
MLPLLLMAAGALQTPPPWGALWIVVPAVGALGYWGNQHPRRPGWLVPVAASAWLVFALLTGEVWAWMLVAGIASATLFGLARAEQVPASRALWSLLPPLVLALAFPLSSLHAPAVAGALGALEREVATALTRYRELGVEGAALAGLTEQMEHASRALGWVLRHLLPSLLFGWTAALVALAVLLARRAAGALGRPLPAPVPFAVFRLPEGALWLLLAGLALVALRTPQLLPAGANLAACVIFGYCLQGLAVAEFVLVMRGVPPGLMWILFLFVSLFALPVVVVTSTGLGLADVWVEWRRRFSAPPGDEAR